MARKGFYMLSEGHELYTEAELCALMKQAESMGLPLEEGSYVESMTIAQLADLVRGRTQA